MQESKKNRAGLLPRPSVEIAKREFVVAVEQHHRDINGGGGSGVGVRFDFLYIQHRVAQGGESVTDFCPMLVALANQLDSQSAMVSIIFFTER